MTAPAAQLGGEAPAAGQPARWFRHALQAPPQAVPDNLHGILAGGARARLRTLALALRRAAGPVAVLACDEAAGMPPHGIPIRDLDLRPGTLAYPFQQPAFRRLCEDAAGELAPLVAACWGRIADQEGRPAAAVRSALSALRAALSDIDQRHGRIAAGRIAVALHGARPWRGWQAGLSVVTAAAEDAARVALVLDGALAQAQAMLRQGDAAVRTLVVDCELLVGPAQESALAIARGGRKANCSCLVLSGTEQLPGWSDHAGFTVSERAGVLWLAIDQDYRIAIDGVVGAEDIVRAHALLHPEQAGG